MATNTEILQYIESLNITDESSEMYSLFQRLNMLSEDLFRKTLEYLMAGITTTNELTELVDVNELTVSTLLDSKDNAPAKPYLEVVANLVQSAFYTSLFSQLDYKIQEYMWNSALRVDTEFLTTLDTLQFVNTKDKYLNEIIASDTVVALKNKLDSAFLGLKTIGINLDTIHSEICAANSNIRFLSTLTQSTPYLNDTHPIGFTLKRYYLKKFCKVSMVESLVENYVVDSPLPDDPFCVSNFNDKLATLDWNKLDSYLSSPKSLVQIMSELILYTEGLAPFINQYTSTNPVPNSDKYNLITIYFDAAYDYLTAISLKVKEIFDEPSI